MHVYCTVRVHLFSQLEHAHERYKLIESHSAGYKRELEMLREKNRQVSDALSRHQSNLSTTTQELLSSREQLAKVKISLQSLQAEHASLQQREKQARNMYEDVLRERKNKNLLLVNLQVSHTHMQEYANTHLLYFTCTCTYTHVHTCASV